jgi:glutamyl-tRNA synthetase
MDDDELARRLLPVFIGAGYAADLERVRRVVPLIKVRIKTLNDALDMAGFIFTDSFAPPPADQIIQKGMDAPRTQAALQAAADALDALPDFGAATQEAAMRALAKQLGLKAGQLFGALRAATTGQQVSPPLFETMEVLGREESLQRIRQAIASL